MENLKKRFSWIAALFLLEMTIQLTVPENSKRINYNKLASVYPSVMSANYYI